MSPVERRRRSRSLRTLTVVVLVLVVLVGLDRLAASIAGRRLAADVQSAQHLSARPDVRIRGFPFLTQVLRGQYREVDVATRGPVVRQGLEVSRADAQLHGVRLSAVDALRGRVRDVPVASGTGSALVTYPALSALLARSDGPLGAAVTVVGDTPGRARLDGPLGISLGCAASIHDGRLLVQPDPADLQALPPLVRTTITDAVATPLTLPPLPFDVVLDSATLEPAGLVLHAQAHDSRFPVR